MVRRTVAYADTETQHTGDIAALTGMECRVTGNEVHLFRDGQDTHEIPESRIKCAGMVWDDRERIVHSASEFLQMLMEERISICYFHNLKFDEYYLSYAILEAEGLLQLTPTRSVRIKERTMGYQGQVYSTVLEFVNSNGRHVRQCQLRDSAKIWAMPLAKLGRMVGLDKGHEALRVGCDAELEEYCLQDCRILRSAMELYFSMVSEATGGKRTRYLTAASTAYNLGRMWVQQEQGLSDRAWSAMYPPCDSEHGFPPWMRLGYKGATPLLDWEIVMRVVYGVTVFDINSDYPFQMITERLPMGSPVDMSHLTSDEVWRLYDAGILMIVRAKIRARVKAGHRATFLLKKKNRNGTTLEDRIDCDDPEQDPWHVLCSPDIDLLIRDYDIEYIEFLDVLTFDSPHRVLPDGSREYVNTFAGFLQHWYDIKTRNKGREGMEGLVAFAKLIINSFYGKFGANPVFDGRTYVYEEGEPLKSVEIESRTDDDPKYLPFAMFVTAYARNYLSRVCNLLGWDHVAYTDTDSVHVHGIKGRDAQQMLLDAGLTCDSITLGGWDMEEEDTPQALYIRPKGYVHADADGNVMMKRTRMAGANGFEGFEHLSDWMDDDAQVMRRRAYKVIGGILIMNEPVAIHGDCIHQRLRMHGHLIEEPERIRDILLKKMERAKHGI